MTESESLTSLDEVEVELDQEVKQDRPYFFQLDVLKAIAIAFVVMDHSLYWDVKGAMGSLFWERLSIPFFLIVMGFNAAYSFKYSGATTLRDLYSREYFKRKIVRYVLPFAVLYMGSILVGMILGRWTFNEYTLLGTLRDFLLCFLLHFNLPRYTRSTTFRKADVDILSLPQVFGSN